jgi:hypothetical protein
MAVVRSLLAELFPAWHQRRLARQRRTCGNANASLLDRFKQKIADEPAFDIRRKLPPSDEKSDNSYNGT